jgi:DNA-binding XRE family transcriptional regulator
MATTLKSKELFKAIRSEGGIAEVSVALALGIIVQRITSLSEEDRNDLFELTKGLATAETCEDRESIVLAILEILEQAPSKLVQMNVQEESQPSAGLKKWIGYVSERIRTLRQKAGWTQNELAEKCGLPQSHISRLENGQHSPSRATLEKIAKALDVSVGEFDPSA